MNFNCLVLGYAQLSFREELVRQLAGIEDLEEVPLYTGPAPARVDKDYQSNHIPLVVEGRFNCKVCYLTEKKQVRTSWTCSSEKCTRCHFCVTHQMNCFFRWHSAEFNGRR